MWWGFRWPLNMQSEVGHLGEYSSIPGRQALLVSTPQAGEGGHSILFLMGINVFRGIGFCIYSMYYSSRLFSSNCWAYLQLFYRSSYQDGSWLFLFVLCLALVVAVHYQYIVHPYSQHTRNSCILESRINFLLQRFYSLIQLYSCIL